MLVAFTIEFDNEAERQISAAGPRPWLVSLAFWSNVLRFVGADEIARLRWSLEGLVDPPPGESPLLSPGLVPHPGGWRAGRPYLAQTTAMVRDPRGTLPHYPMVLHRGGFPDGS